MLRSRSSYARLGAAVWLICSATTATAAPTVTMELDPQEVRVGEAAQLTVTVNNGSSSDLTPPAVPGLEFVAVGQSKGLQWVNGSMTSSTSVTYDVVAQRPGQYTIPAMSPGAAPLNLQVLADDGSAGSGQNPQNPQGSLPPPRSGQGADAKDSDEANPHPEGLTFSRLIVPKNGFYVGQTVPVEIQVAVQAGIRAGLDGLPSLTGDAFALSALSSHPEQATKTFAGREYTVLTWHATLSSLKSGSYTLNIETPVTLQLPAAMNARPSGRGGNSPFDSMFNDPFFQRMRPPVEKQVKVASTPETLNILPLPTEGRPADFSGAVGQFTVSSELSDNKAVVGDPVTLKLHISGIGNFDRVDSSMLASGADWKTYRPSSRFTAHDIANYGGEKLFEQAIVAIRPGHNTVPALSFSFFDPTTQRYETRLTDRIDVEVAPGTVATTPPVAAATVPASAASATVASTPDADDGLRPDQVETGNSVGSLVPLYFRPWFLALQMAIVLGFASAALRLQYRQRAAGRRRLSQQESAQSIDAALATMRAASVSGDTRLFFRSARSALQRQLAKRWRLAPEAITTAEIEGRLATGGAELRRVFAMADEVEYSGRPMKSADFQLWTQAVMSQLKLAESA